MAIVCHGCGARLNIPEDYARNKMQCPECGVMCPLPPRSPAKKKAEERPPAKEAVRFDDEPAASSRPATPPAASTAYAEEPPPAEKGVARCPLCGELVRVPGRKSGRREPCPACGADWPELPLKKKAAPAPVAVAPPPDEFAGSSPDQDPDSGNPYRTADSGARRCPGCSAQLGPEVVVCVRCGFDLRTGRKAVKEYQKFALSWDSGMSLPTRLALFALCQAAAVAAIAAAALALEDSPAIAVPTFGFSWLVYTAMTAFVLGTFDHIRLKRSRSGRVDLTKKWRIGFIPFAPRAIDVRAYRSVVTGARAYATMWEWLIFGFLFISGIFPSVVYWYCVIYKTDYTVSLANEHGGAEELVYSGWSQQQMHEVRDALRDAMTV